MRRLLPLAGAVLALALAGAASADTFRVARPHHTGGGTRFVAFAPDSTVIPFTEAQSGPMTFAALRSIWQAAGNAYGIPWTVLAAINKVETDFGRNLGPSSAGAIGWMQFMPSTWARWGVDANGDGIADPDNPTDAIFSAAHYLAGCGGQFDIAAAVYCYNHATWYVNDVLSLAAQYAQGGVGGVVGTDGVVSNAQLQAQIDRASNQVASAHTQLEAALVQARKLARAQRPFLRRAAHARVLSDRLEAQRRAVLLAVRRHAADERVAQLRDLLETATEHLNDVQARTPATPILTGAGAGLEVGRIDQGVDYTSSSPYTAVASGTVVYIDPNFWEGTPSVYEKLDSPIVVDGRSYDEIYYAETPALVQVGQRLAPGDPVIGPGSAEIGFASGELPAAHSIYHEGDQTQAGHDFYTYMTAGRPGGGAAPARFFLLSGPVDSFQTGSVSGTFTSDVVYFTH
jgi:hypothetical protein